MKGKFSSIKLLICLILKKNTKLKLIKQSTFITLLTKNSLSKPSIYIVIFRVLMTEFSLTKTSKISLNLCPSISLGKKDLEVSFWGDTMKKTLNLVDLIDQEENLIDNLTIKMKISAIVNSINDRMLIFVKIRKEKCLTSMNKRNFLIFKWLMRNNARQFTTNSLKSLENTLAIQVDNPHKFRLRI